MPIDPLSSLLKQLVLERSSMPESVKNLYERDVSKRNPPIDYLTILELQQLLQWKKETPNSARITYRKSKK